MSMGETYAVLAYMLGSLLAWVPTVASIWVNWHYGIFKSLLTFIGLWLIILGTIGYFTGGF